MYNNKISSHPPHKKSIEEFILEAECKKKNLKSDSARFEAGNYPWNDPLVRPDIQKVFTVKLPEEYILKIKYISKKTNKSQQKIVREILCQKVDELLNNWNKKSLYQD